MKSYVLLLSLFCISTSGLAQDLDREFKMGAGKRIEFDLRTGGKLTINGTESDVVRVKVKQRATGDDRDANIEFDEVASGLRISSSMPKYSRGYSTSLRFELSVPHKTNLEIESAGGAISIDGVEGDISGRTMGGELVLTNLQGQID